MANENVINFQPQQLDLKLYAGDGAKFRVVCTDGAGSPIDLSGTIKAQIRLQRLTPDPPIVSFSVNSIDAYLGTVILSLTGAQTTDLSQDASSKAGRFSGVWDLQWAASGAEPKTLCQGIVECVADVSR